VRDPGFRPIGLATITREISPENRFDGFRPRCEPASLVRGWLRRNGNVWLVALVAFARSAGAQVPSTYAEFDASIAPGDAGALRAAIVAGQTRAIFLQPGRYVLENPVVIDRAQPLLLHGSDRSGVVLVSRNPSQPLFLVRAAPRLNFASLDFQPSANAPETLDSRAIASANAQPVVLEIQDCNIDRATVEFAGPGSYRIQSSAFMPGGRVRTPLLVDHPDADVLLFGGDTSNGGEPLRADSYAHVWQKRGRIRIYAITFEGGLGPADVRIETASPLGPHILGNVRSEGANGALNRRAISRLLQVPPTPDRVDVLLKSNGGAWDTGPEGPREARMNCKFVDYNAAGTLWLIGNRAEGLCGRTLVEGNAPNATIVSIGNLISSPQPFAVRGARIVSSADAYNHYLWTGQDTNPWTRWIPDGASPARLASFKDVPAPPDDVLPPALDRPVVTAALPGMVDVRSFGAKGDGKNDDTAAIQRALDSGCDPHRIPAVYFPAGTYRIRDTLRLRHHAGGACHVGTANGGWIAGAGSARTVIAMDPSVKKGTFATDGLIFATVQGITFRTFPWHRGDPEEPNFDLEFHPGHVATQLNNFYDVVFDGGYAGFASGVRAPTGGQCSSNVLFGGRLTNTHIGFVSGHYNSIANGVYDAEFVDNDVAIGSWTTDEKQLPPGGTFFAYRSRSRGTRERDFVLRGTANGSTFYTYAWVSDAPAYFQTGSSAAAWPLLFDRAELTPRPGSNYLFDVGTSQGPIFLYSKLSRGGIRVGQSVYGQSYAISLGSEIPDWNQSVAPAATGLLDAMSWSHPKPSGSADAPNSVP
jgi:pectate lyase-like protein